MVLKGSLTDVKSLMLAAIIVSPSDFCWVCVPSLSVTGKSIELVFLIFILREMLHYLILAFEGDNAGLCK